jgi:hypothetical protein
VKNLFEAKTVEEVKERMAQLRPDSERLWGKMNPAQAPAWTSYCCNSAPKPKKWTASPKP